MREIKFRVWDVKGKEFLDYCPLDEEGHCCMGESSLNEDYFDNSEYKVTQYTGLKDKNGKEIYEGDIIKFFIFFEHKYFTSRVTYEEGDATFRLSGNGRHMLFSYQGIEQVEVIGNIYENQELLENL